MNEFVVVLDSHRFDDTRISKQISSVNGPYHVLRLNLNFYPDRSGEPGNERAEVFDYVPTRNEYLNGLLMAAHASLGGFCARLESRMRREGMEREDAVLFHVHDPYLLGLATKLAKRFPRSRVLYDRHEYYETWTNRFGISVPGLFERRYGKKVSEVVFVSRAIDRLPECLVDKRTTVVPNYPEAGRFDRRLAEEKIESFGEGDVLAVYFGALNLDFDRDMETMFEVARCLMRSDATVRFEVAGRVFDRPLKEMMDHMEKEFGARMRYLGEIPYSEVIERTQRAHLGFFLLRPESPTWSEERPVSPNKVYEFLLSGTIPVVKAVLDDRTMMERCALLFDKEATAEDIARALLALIEDKERMRGMMRGCLAIAPNFSWERVSQGYLQCYERLFASMRTALESVGGNP